MAVKTNVTELPESRVRVEAEVPSEEVERRVQQAARELGRQMRIPGFRRGKVPPPVVIRRLGREAVLDEALRSSLGGWYVDAIAVAGIAPVGEPDLDVGDMPAEGEPLAFSIEIGVRPVATLGEYKGLEVGRREPQADEERIDAELESLRDRFATLETVERPAGTGDRIALKFGSHKFNLRPTGTSAWVTAKVDAPGSLDLCFITEGSLKPFIARWEKAGIPVTMGPGPRAGALGPMTSVYCEDPDGNLIEVATYASDPLA